MTLHKLGDTARSVCVRLNHGSSRVWIRGQVIYIRNCLLIHTHLIWNYDVSKLKEILAGSANSKDMDDILTKDEHETIGITSSCFEQPLS